MSNVRCYDTLKTLYEREMSGRALNGTAYTHNRRRFIKLAAAYDCLETAIKVWKDTKADPTRYSTGIAPNGAAPARAAGLGVLAASRVWSLARKVVVGHR